MVLDLIAGLCRGLNVKSTRNMKRSPRQRLNKRDEEDWPVVAAALAFDCPIWTEDTDFFGCGVAT
jgi:predicted nucleic acid-binding protein